MNLYSEKEKTEKIKTLLLSCSRQEYSIRLKSHTIDLTSDYLLVQQNEDAQIL